ncbi:MAG: peptidyl-tRNA hydrolase, PTH1 family [Candidatus Berkelbacteria bacterium Gr01-1014_85]|uniref:Peptidyl-tRNA hydrolase, PTH1 family n=1 Tax=Candidatus Berkelbacteria bacterium Gr01-1014_85 TaxID=2017150 RepID=A0A554JCN1_9BACT|nr:MAG: peptidyl-tRNA hydrolase, PTH1 family [Candidatus Berkelbacteria bacterium Gr01-1014_85]
MTKWVIAGLGNPEARYQATRHNFGEQLLLKLADSLGSSDWQSDRHQRNLTLKHQLTPEVGLELIRPQLYMNRSGEAIQSFLDYYHLEPAQLIVLADELDLPLGTAKFQWSGQSAGHHGLDSIIEALKTSDFWRLRLGIASSASTSGSASTIDSASPGRLAGAEFVLAPFAAAELPAHQASLELFSQWLIRTLAQPKLSPQRLTIESQT